MVGVVAPGGGLGGPGSPGGPPGAAGGPGAQQGGQRKDLKSRRMRFPKYFLIFFDDATGCSRKPSRVNKSFFARNGGTVYDLSDCFWASQ